MKVLHINTSNRGGAGIAALRLHEALHVEGIQSAFISKGLSVDFNNNIIKDSFFEYKKPSLLKRFIAKISLSTNNQLISKFNSIKKKIDCEIVSLPVSKYKLHEHPLVLEADIINLHWVGDLVNYSTFFNNFSKPIVYTMHDMNPFKGIFHYQTDENKNPDFKDWEANMLNIKKEALINVNNGALVSPSKWLLDEAIKTGVFSNFKTQEVIQNSIDIKSAKTFTSKEEARADLGLTTTEKVILFVSNAIEIERKGLKLLKQALESIDISITLLTVGKGEVTIANTNVLVKSLGFVNDIDKITKAYNAADVLVLPSLEDNLPNTMLEAFSYGVPVISFMVGGMKEHIDKNSNGILVKDLTSKSLKQTVEDFFNKENKFDTDKIKQYAADNFSFKNQASKYISVYNRLLN
ncbi:MAG: glycosyltransferase [Winogradskyella sp.]|uniref:glycosyltransferase n=1 Tax=Winogradskyella sp. TaxID=1883156 RepID=UPI0025E1A3DA|nr:glycosyltransferase [Winogradskyella sp.]NRB59415.1 glycosyltransferase [Winogradskyella sp.]